MSKDDQPKRSGFVETLIGILAVVTAIALLASIGSVIVATDSVVSYLVVLIWQIFALIGLVSLYCVRKW